MFGCLLFSFCLHRTRRKEEDADREFWECEYRANFTRKKPLDDLNYITVPEHLLSMKPELMTDELAECLSELQDLSDAKIVNLTGYTNTDLKLKYGTANITILSDCDFHYTNLVKLLQNLPNCCTTVSRTPLQSKCWSLLSPPEPISAKAIICSPSSTRRQARRKKSAALSRQAQTLHSIMKDAIVENLQAADL